MTEVTFYRTNNLAIEQNSNFIIGKVLQKVHGSSCQRQLYQQWTNQKYTLLEKILHEESLYQFFGIVPVWVIFLLLDENTMTKATYQRKGFSELIVQDR